MRTIALVLLLTAAATAMASGSVHATGAHTTKNQLTQPIKHIVAAGESLSSIATNSQLASWRPLWNANADLQNPDQIEVGEQLVIPSGPTTDRPLPAGYDQPAPAPVSSLTTDGSGAAATAAHAPVAKANTASGDLFARIRARESGGNYAENTGNGYYGAYQFSLGTWQGVGGTGNPAAASPAEQDLRAQMLYARRGCSPWPQTCY